MIIYISVYTYEFSPLKIDDCRLRCLSDDDVSKN